MGIMRSAIIASRKSAQRGVRFLNMIEPKSGKVAPRTYRMSELPAKTEAA